MKTTTASVSTPLFQQSAEDLVQRLSAQSSDRARRMLTSAQELAKLFKSWEMVTPEPAARLKAINTLFDLHREAMDFLSGGSPGPKSAKVPIPR